MALADSGDLLAGGIEPALLGGGSAGIGLGLGVIGTSKGYGDGSVFVVAQSAKIRGNPVGLVGKVIVDRLGVMDQVIALICPKRIVIGGGVSLLGEATFFKPLRAEVSKRVFRPYVGLTEIVPATLGEEVVLHGALALATQPGK
jgi:hypothetical protein